MSIFYTSANPVRNSEQDTLWFRVAGDENHANLEMVSCPLPFNSKEKIKVLGIVPSEISIDGATGKVNITCKEVPFDCLRALEYTYRQVLIDHALIVPERGKRYLVGWSYYVALNRYDAERLAKIVKTDRIVEANADIVHCSASKRWALWSDGKITTGNGLPAWASEIKSLSKDAEYLISAYRGSDSIELFVDLKQILNVSKIISKTIEKVSSHGISVYAPPRIERMEVEFADGTRATWWLSSVGYMEGYTFDLFPCKQDALKSLIPDLPEKTEITEMGGQLWERCEKCGREPVYMPLHLCEHCWPK